MKSIFKSVLVLGMAAGLFIGCAEGDHYDNSNASIQTYELTVTKTVAETKAQTTPTPTQYNYDTEQIIEAYVTSSDETGNFYNSISFQTIPNDGSNPIGFSVAVNLRSWQRGFTPGRKVYIKLNGLYRAIVDGSMKIGAKYQPNPTDPIEVGRISENDWRNFLFPSSTIEDEDDFVRTLPLSAVYTNDNINTLVEIENVRFVDASLGRTYFDIDSGGGATNHYLISTTGGNSQIIRFSSFAPFTTHPVPANSGNIRGVLTKYQSDFQFLVRSENDIKLTTPRAFTFSGSFSENFETSVLNQNNFPNYINDPVVGNKVWVVKNTATNYIEMTSFNSGETNRTLFFVPVDFTAASTFTFQYKVSFLSSGHIPLKVYYSTNYVPGQNPLNATLVNITAGFSGLGAQSATNFTSAGTYNIPANVTGNGFMIFEYTGSNSNPTHTTNLGIDNIAVN